jgi:hypothetical protein
MKKLLAITALGVLTLASFKKDYTCECTATNTFYNASTPIKDAKKKDAQKTCDTNNDNYASVAGGKCVLK